MARPKGTSSKPPTNGTAPLTSEPEHLPAYFLSLTVENVRCFGPKQTLDLSDGHGKPAPWTIILGLNGTGKTTLLQALVGVEKGLRTHTDIDHESIALVASLAWFDVRSFCRSGFQIHTAVSAYSAHCSLQGAPPLSVEEHRYEFDGFFFSGRGAGAKPDCIAYGAGRRVGTATLGLTKPDSPIATLFSDQAELRSPEEWLLQLDYAAAKSPQDKDTQHRLAQAKELLLNILPDIEDIRFTTVSGPNPRPRAEFQTPYGWVPLRQLGYGYQTLVTWVADLVSRMSERYPDSANPLAEPAVVLVDEIDLHLHPIWQRKLMGFLTERFPNTQFIATAHSPLVAQAAADANLAVLRREGDHVVIDNEVDNIRDWRIDQILTSDLFGLKTARPPHVEAMMLEQETLLAKPKRNAADERRLKELDELVGELPFGETKQERQEREEMLRLLKDLAKERKPAS